MENFSDIALAKLLESAPELSPMILNFSDITSEAELSDVSVGVFSLNTGAGIAFVPAVARGGTVYPLDSIFLQEEKRFLPLTRSTIGKLTNAAGNVLGKANKIPESVIKNPDMSALMVPPRTGKYVYASSSRLTEFLAALPEHLKTFTFEKIAAEQSVYENMDRMFGLKAIITALKQAAKPLSNINSGATGPSPIIKNQFSVITSPREIRNLMDDVLTQRFLQNGYVVQGQPPVSRIAVGVSSYDKDGKFQTVTPGEVYGTTYNVVMADGSYKRGYVPRYHAVNPVNKANLATIFDDGSYACGSMVVSGDFSTGPEVLSALFEYQPPCLLRDCYNNDRILMITSGGEALGPFTVSNVALTADGADVKISGTNKAEKIIASKNLRQEVNLIGTTLFVQHNVIVIKLGSNLTYELETSHNQAWDKRQLITTQLLGAELDLGYDGFEFAVNGSPVGGKPQVMKVLVEREQIDPEVAESFIKQAEEKMYLKIFLSKQAELGGTMPTPIPQFGNRPDSPGAVGPGGSFMPALREASALGDAQVMEATVISQLLQVPDLFEMVSEYLPEINDAVDKLGRLLFLSRVKIDQLAAPMDSDSVFALIAQIKNVYRQLGDASTKLEQISNASTGYVSNKGQAEATGV